ncbi:MAG: PQQ-binding-like beta-propeller repeat protein [Bacteroidales bacterium]
MRRVPDRILKAIPLALIVLGVSVIFWWIRLDPTSELAVAQPGRDGYSDSGGIDETIVIGEFFNRFASAETVLNERWPRFRGEHADNILRSDIPLIDRFSDQGPEVVWTADLGEGHAGAAIFDGLVYVLDYDEDLRADMLRCYELTTGREIWRRWYDVQIRRNHGMSRTVPALDEKFILTIGPRGHVMCLDRLTGDFLWGLDIEKEYESEIPLWYTGQCPMIDQGVAVIATGGNALMIGVDCATGEVLWETPNPGNWTMSHSSVMPFAFEGHRMYVYSASGGVAGIAADGPDTGDILWETSRWNHPVVAASPVCMPDGKIFLTAGYGAGSMLIQLRENNGLEVEVLDAFRPGEGLSSEQQTPILTDGHLFGVLPKDARSLRNQLVCVRADDPTEIVWSSGPTSRFGLGPYILADGKFYLLDDDATLYIIQKSTREYIELDRVKLFDGHDAWAPLAVADGYMVLRDSETILCINVKK